MSGFSIEPIGYIRSPWNDKKNMPVQPPGAVGVEGKIIMKEEYVKGITNINTFSYIYIIYKLDRMKNEEVKLLCTPYCDRKQEVHGVFATRSPKRPNGLGLSVVEVKRVEGNVIYIDGVDVLDETPLIDIKPLIPVFECNVDRKNARTGYCDFSPNEMMKKRSDDRFD